MGYLCAWKRRLRKVGVYCSKLGGLLGSELEFEVNCCMSR